MKTIVESITAKLINKEKLNEEEQYLIKEELKIAKTRIHLQRLTTFLIIFVEIVFFAYIGYRIVLGLKTMGLEDTTSKKEHVAVLNLDKPIMDDYADKFNTRLTELVNEKNVKSVLIKLRSPGGSPSASWNIATHIKSLQESKIKPIYVYVDSAAVSGSYMIASQADKIYANRFAMVGSIGVIMEHIVAEDLAKKIGVGEETLTAGKYKKFLSSFKYLNNEQKKYIEETMLNVVYKDFVGVVANGRKMDSKELEKFAEGRIFIASDNSIQLKLIDQLIDLPDMEKLIIKEQGLSNKIGFNVYELEKKNIGLGLLGSSLDLNMNMNLNKDQINLK